MAIVRVYDHSVGQGTCRSCGAPITWALLDTTKRMPFDGELVYVRTTSDKDGQVLGHVDTTVNKSHFATCPQAAHWRRK